MPQLANVALTDTFDTWRTRTNQSLVQAAQIETNAIGAYDKANAANVLAFNAGATITGANNYMTATVAGANNYMTATVAGANTAVGGGANAFTSATVAGANAYMIAVQNGSNTAVGTGANTYLLATLAGANTAVGGGANAYMIAVQNGSNTAVGTGANNYLLAVIAGANTAVGGGANAYMIAVQNGANTAVGTGANNYMIATVTGANNIAIAAFAKANSLVSLPAVGAKTSSYQLAVGDVGKYVEVGTGGSITIPNATFAAGDVVSIFNNTTGSVTITCSIATAYIAGVDADKASVSLGTRGVATILFISGTVCVITGNVT